MREGIRLILEQTQYFGLVLSIGAYLFACWLKNKTKLAILNPLLVSAALMCGAVKLESVEGTGNFLMDTMTMMFIPATVGIVECIGEVKAVLVPFLIIIGISTLLVMAVTGCMAQWVMGRKHSGEEQ